MHYPRWDGSAVVYRNFIFAIGGMPSPAGTKIERYNIELDMWNILPVTLPKPLTRVPVFVAPRDRIAILGGQGSFEIYILFIQDIRSYDLETVTEEYNTFKILQCEKFLPYFLETVYPTMYLHDTGECVVIDTTLKGGY